MKAAVLTIKRMKLDDLRPHPRNPRSHPEPGSPEWDVLKASLASDYFDPVVFNKRNKLLVSGHLRVKVLKDLGYTHADCAIVDYDERTHVARMLAANKLIGEDDAAAVKDLLLELDEANFDLSLTGFEAGEIETMMTACAPSAEDQDAEKDGDGEPREVECPKCHHRWEE